MIVEFITVILFFVFGITIGSFLNVCIYRMPIEKSIVFPVSHCPHCQSAIAPYDNIPLLSYLILRGKCRHCAQPISIRYPLVEGLNGVMYVLTYLRFGLSGEAVVYALFISAMIVVAIIDYDHQIIPDEISLGGIPLGFLAAILTLNLTWVDSFLGILVGAGILLAFAIFWQVAFHYEGMGHGDIKLLATVGAFLGWKLAVFTIILGSLAGTIVGIGLIQFGGKDLKTKVPYGTFLAPAAIGAVFGGQAFIHWYLSLFRF